jgi:hypothetical protein
MPQDRIRVPLRDLSPSQGRIRVPVAALGAKSEPPAPERKIGGGYGRLEAIGNTIRNAATPENIGGTIGGIAGATIGPLGAIGGAALGGAAGRGYKNLYYLLTGKTQPTTATDAAKDLAWAGAEQGAYEGAGGLLAKGARAVAQAVPPKLRELAIRKIEQAVKPRESALRNMPAFRSGGIKPAQREFSEAMLDERVGIHDPAKFGEKAKALDAQVDDLVDTASGPADLEAVAGNLGQSRKRFQRQAIASDDLASIDAVERKFRAEPQWTRDVTVQEPTGRMTPGSRPYTTAGKEAPKSVDAAVDAEDALRWNQARLIPDRVFGGQASEVAAARQLGPLAHVAPRRLLGSSPAPGPKYSFGGKPPSPEMQDVVKRVFRDDVTARELHEAKKGTYDILRKKLERGEALSSADESALLDLATGMRDEVSRLAPGTRELLQKEARMIGSRGVLEGSQRRLANINDTSLGTLASQGKLRTLLSLLNGPLAQSGHARVADKAGKALTKLPTNQRGYAALMRLLGIAVDDDDDD